MSTTSSGNVKAVRILRVALPVAALLCTAAAGLCGASALDLSVRGGYFIGGNPLPYVFCALLVLCCGAGIAHAMLSIEKERTADAYFVLSPFFALLPALGILLCTYGLLRPFTPTTQTFASLVCLCSGLVYFPTFFRTDVQKPYRFVTGIVFMLWPVISFVYSFIDWYVPLNSPSKLLYQFALLAFAFFICEELRASSGAPNKRALSASCAVCAVFTASAAVFLTAGQVTYPVAGGDGTICLLLSVAIYAGARWHAMSCYKESITGAYTGDNDTVTKQEPEDNNNAG